MTFAPATIAPMKYLHVRADIKSIYKCNPYPNPNPHIKLNLKPYHNPYPNPNPHIKLYLKLYHKPNLNPFFLVRCY